MKMKFYILIFSILLLSCNNNRNADSENTNQLTNDYKVNDKSNINNYHTNSNYKYESRTGNSGDYNYNYDINGSDQDGNNVTGNIDINGKYGSGTITDEDGNEKTVDVEWVNKGALEGTDEDGNSYDLEVE
jgi:replication-associated recombination protein RarA